MILRSKFVDREREMKYLEDRYHSGEAELILIYGRRRIGKTYLLQKLIDKFGGVYLLSEESEKVLEDFSRILATKFNDSVLKENPLRNWSAFFAYLGEKSRKERIIVVIDEVQYLVRIEKGFLTILQKQWDSHLSNTKIMLILCSSTISFMEGVMSYKSPIYGRKTGSWEVGEIPYYNLSEFYDIPKEEVVRIYSVFGGVPQYWGDYNPEKNFWDNLRELVIEKGSKYYDEPKYLLKMELRDVSRYFAILRSIAQGYTRFGEIADKSRIDTSSLGKYLSVLENLGYVVVEHSIGSRRGGIYRIKDNFFDFWFRYVYPNRVDIEMGIDIVPVIRKDFNRYVGKKFEEIAKNIVKILNAMGKLPEKYEKIGRWWHKGEEIDIVGLGKKTILLGEVKWKKLNCPDIRRLVNDLSRKAEHIQHGDMEMHYLIVGREINCDEKLSPYIFGLEEMFNLHRKS